MSITKGNVSPVALLLSRSASCDPEIKSDSLRVMGGKAGVLRPLGKNPGELGPGVSPMARSARVIIASNCGVNGAEGGLDPLALFETSSSREGSESRKLTGRGRLSRFCLTVCPNVSSLSIRSLSVRLWVELVSLIEPNAGVVAELGSDGSKEGNVGIELGDSGCCAAGTLVSTENQQAPHQNPNIARIKPTTTS
jgi:hypothetical protein